MNIYIRVDIHPKIGIGHIMRCLKLCSYIENNNNIFFLSKNYNCLDENIFLKLEKYNLIKLEIENDLYINEKDMLTWLGENYENDAIKSIKKLKNCDLLIIDHYSIDYKWENLVRMYTKKIFVIEDCIGRKQICVIILISIINKNNSFKNITSIH